MAGPAGKNKAKKFQKKLEGVLKAVVKDGDGDSIQEGSQVRLIPCSCHTFHIMVVIDKQRRNTRLETSPVVILTRRWFITAPQKTPMGKSVIPHVENMVVSF